MPDTPHPAPTGDPLVLAAICLAALILPLSFSAGAVATPSIGRELGGSPEALTWITNGFMLTFGSLLMAAGTLADRYGRRLVFTAGVATVTGFSLALGFAPALWVVDLLRAGQGIGAAAAWRAAPRRSPRNSTAMPAPGPSACSGPPSASAWPSARSSPAS